MTIDEARIQLRRRAIVLKLGGFRPPDSLEASWFGRVNLADNGEGWPESEGEPMQALCQLNLNEMPFRPPRLDDTEFITVFIGTAQLPSDDPNGINWCLRSYPSVHDLVPLTQEETTSELKQLPMRPQIVENDFPMWEDVPIGLSEFLDDSYYDHFENADGFKLGGWPTLVQSEIFWAPWNRHPASPEFVFQIDSTEKGNWAWGHDGVGYFGRGTAAGHTDEWTCAWQCF